MRSTPTMPAAAAPARPDVIGLLALAVAPFGTAFPLALMTHLKGTPLDGASPADVEGVLKAAGYGTRTTTKAKIDHHTLPVLVWYAEKGKAKAALHGPWLRLPHGAWYSPAGAAGIPPEGARVSAAVALTRAPELEGTPQGLEWFWQPFKGVGGLVAKVLAAGLVVQLAGMMLPLFSMAVYDRVLPIGATNTLWLMVLGMGIVLALDVVLRLLRSYGLAAILASASGQQDDVLLGFLLRQKGMGERPSEQMELLRITHELREQLVMHVLPNLADVPMVLLFIGMIGWLAPALLPVPVALLVLTMLLQLALLPQMKRIARQQNNASHQRVVAQFEIVRSALAARLHNRQQDSLNRWRVQADRLHATEASGQLWQGLGQHVTVTVAQLSFVVMLVVGAEMVMNNGLTVGVLVACSMLCSRAMTPALHLVDTLVRVQKIRVGLKQLRHGLNHPLETLTTSDAAPDFLPACHGQLTLANVGVTLPERPGRPVLSTLNLRIGGGERWAVVGSNGAGKSTLLATLAGFVDPTEGTLQLDGVDYNRMPVSEVRRHVVLVPQEPRMPDVTLREIIVGMAPVNDILLAEALDVSGFGRVLNELGSGLELRPGPDGERLSGGQRQMLALAAAIYRVPRVLLLDEPTSAFDPDAERHVTERLQVWLQRRNVTLVLVTHRVGLLELVDNMIVLAQGRMIYGGPKKDVMKKLRGGTVDG